MKKLTILASILLIAIAFVSCGEDNPVETDPEVTPPEEQKEIKITDNITSDQTWKDGKVYVLGGRIAVEAGATLSIEGGAIVKGVAGTVANSTALLVARDATLNDIGTADAPVIFTSVADEITPEMV